MMEIAPSGPGRVVGSAPGGVHGTPVGGVLAGDRLVALVVVMGVVAHRPHHQPAGVALACPDGAVWWHGTRPGGGPLIAVRRPRAGPATAGGTRRRRAHRGPTARPAAPQGWGVAARADGRTGRRGAPGPRPARSAAPRSRLC